MNNWKSGFFLIDRRAIPDAMVWRHPGAAIDDPRPAGGSFNMADVHRLSAHVIKLRDMPEGVLVLSGLSRVWKNRFCDPVLRGANGNVMGIHDFFCLPEWTGAEVQEEPHLDVRPTLQRLLFYCTPPATADAVIPNPTLEDLAAGTPSFKILAKAEASQKRKASTSGAASSHVAKHTRSALAQSSGSTTRPNLFVGDSDDESDGDDDACVEIPLVTPLRFAAVIPSSGNQGRSSAAPTTEGSNTRDSRGKGIMVDDAVAPSGGVSRQRPSSRPAPLFRDVSSDSIHMDLFPFSAGPYYATYPEDGVAGNYEFTQEEWDAPYRPTFGVLTKEVFMDPTVLSTLKKQVSGLNDKLATFDASFAKSKAKGKERKKKIKSLGKSLDNLHADVARLSAALNQATILEAERDEEILRLKTTPSEFSSFFRGQFQGLVRKFLASDEFSRVQGELLSLAASAGFERGLSMHQTKDEFAAVLKKMVNFMPGAQETLTEASPHVAQTDYSFLNKISEYVAEPLSVILRLELEKLVRPTNVPILRDTRVSPPIAKESTMTPVSNSLELSANVVPASFAIALEQNEEQGTSHVLDDVTEVTVVGSERVSSGLTDVVVALSAGEKGDGSASSSTVEEGRGAWYAGEHLLLRAWGKLTVDMLLSIQRILMLLDICYDYKSIQLLPLASWLQFGFAPGALLVALPFLLLLVSSIDGLVLIPTDTSWLRNSSFIVASPVNTSAFRFKIFGRCVIRNLWNGTIASIISSLYLLSYSVIGVWFPSTRVTNVNESTKTCKSFIPLLAEAASPANSASQSMAWLDALNFKRMAYEYIFSSGLIRMIPIPEPSLIVSLPKYNLQALVVGVEFA
ncbi:hypothetical protein Tco_0194271 [Tanacetum coccineum]